MQRTHFIRWSLTILYWLLLTKILLSPNPWVTIGGEKLSFITTPPDPSDTLSSIIMHAGSFFILFWLISWSNNFIKNRLLVFFFIITILYGIGIEFMQSLIPNRFMNIEDILGNILGVLIVYLLITKIKVIKLKWP